MPHDPLLKHLEGLRLARLGDERPAGLHIASLPLPRNAPTGLSLGRLPAYTRPLGQWHDAPGCPRRLLIIADGRGAAPEALAVNVGAALRGRPRDGRARGRAPTAPTVEMRLIGRNPEPLVYWESHALRISWGSHFVELAMGMRTGSEVHWWQACRLITLEDSAACRVIEMGGAIPRDVYSWETADEAVAFANRVLHKHNWLNGHIYARLHANGVCEIYAHHINGKFFDDGLPLEDAVPVIGIRSDAGSEVFGAVTGPWDGSRKELQLGEVRFDVTDAAHLASAQQPGSLAAEGDFLVWQPYLGMELYGASATMQRLGDPFVVHAEDRIILRGMARTLRFSFSLSPERPPAVVRYQAPAWWYGACEELMPEPLLPVSNDYDRTLANAREWIASNMVRRGFEDGSVPRGGAKPGMRGEPGWEGEMPYAQFLSAWRTGDASEHDDALRSAYHFTDLAVDHAVKMVRMHGWPPNAFALPMARVLGPIAAYLETGDPYLLDTARAVVETTYWVHKNSWPRLGVGRDSCFARGAMLLYRYLGEPRYLAIARDTIADVIASQRENGSFGDQGGGSGAHQMGGYISKPWMGLMALGGALDYLEMFPDDQEVLAGVKRFADWMMAERFDHNGVMGWSYQHEYAGGRIYPAAGKVTELPGSGLWHLEYLARFLMFCALRFDRREYFEAWEESYQACGGKGGGDHRCAQALQYIPWLQAKLLQARITEDGVSAHPVWLGDRTPRRGTILGPEGPVELVWRDEGDCVASGNVEVRPRTVAR